jgi:glucose/arabinose dehydrogenase
MRHRLTRSRAAGVLSAVLLAVLRLTVSGSAVAATVPTDFQDEPAVTVGGGAALSLPASMAFLSDGRLLVVEQKSAKIRLFVNGALAATDPVATLPDVRTAGNEQGLLGIAVDPGWPVRPYLYVHCDDANSSFIRISRYTAAGDLAFATDGHITVDPATRYDLLNRLPDSAPNHNGGTVRFGVDGMLYASLGDDMDHCAAQDSSVLVGKILRLDVSRLPAGAGGPAPFAILAPPGNPYAAAPDSNARLVWEEGFRNPFRFSIDPADGALFIGDVGEESWEEVDRTAVGGRNLGWPLYEGPAFFNYACSNPLVAGDAPIYAFARSGQTAAIVGGTAYRRPVTATAAFPSTYEGDYFFSDYYLGFLRRLSGSGSTWALAATVPGQPSATDWGQGFGGVSDWMIGPDGAIWYCLQSPGDIRRIRYTGALSVPPSAGGAIEFAPPRPSPAIGAVTLRYTLPGAARVSLAVFDAGGRRVRVLEPAQQKGPDRYDVRWDGTDDAGRSVRPGIYFARLEVSGRALERRIALLR